MPTKRFMAALPFAVFCLGQLPALAYAGGPSPQLGHYYFQAIVLSVTADGGAVQADCTAAYPAAGTQNTGIATLALGKGGAIVTEVRGGVLAETGGYGYESSLFEPTSGSKFTNQKGSVTLFVNGQKSGVVPYTATGVVLDQQSFSAKETITLPGPTGTGTCLEQQQATFTYSGS